jgi:acetyltransferase-like isoleucine patch superfamily enzyme
MIGPNVSLYSSTHPIDPDLRNGTKGPELGGHITIGEDCWIGGNVTILPNVTIGNGCTIGAASVVTKVSYPKLEFSSIGQKRIASDAYSEANAVSLY